MFLSPPEILPLEEVEVLVPVNVEGHDEVVVAEWEVDCWLWRLYISAVVELEDDESDRILLEVV